MIQFDLYVSKMDGSTTTYLEPKWPLFWNGKGLLWEGRTKQVPEVVMNFQVPRMSRHATNPLNLQMFVVEFMKLRSDDKYE